MKLRNWALAGAALGAMVLAAPAAHADLVRFSLITATWSNVLGGSNVNFAGNGTANASVNWGTPTNAQSGYDFFAVGVPTAGVAVNPPAVSTDFVLGTFRHRNQPINAGTSITGVQLTIAGTVQLSTDGGLNWTTIAPPKNFIFDFDHWETPNGDNPCANGQPNGAGVNINGCADRVKVNANSATDSFTVGDVEYTLNIIGFLAGSSFATEFWTVENATNEARIIANVAARDLVIPEPATMALLGVGLAGLGLAARRRRKTA